MDEDKSTPTIRNATCGNCSTDGVHRVLDRVTNIEPDSEEPEDSFVLRTVECIHCGAESTVESTRAGTTITGSLVPSWRQDDDESDSDDDEGQPSEEESEPSESQGESLSETQEELFG